MLFDDSNYTSALLSYLNSNTVKPVIKMDEIQIVSIIFNGQRIIHINKPNWKDTLSNIFKFIFIISDPLKRSLTY